MEEQEEFRPIQGYEGKYEVSSFGRVRSLPKHAFPERFIGGRTKAGYILAALYLGDNKPVYAYVHRLVAEAFLEKPDSSESLSVNHVDGNKGNNILANLEWATHKENMGHAMRTGLSKRGKAHGNAVLSDDDVLAIRELYKSHSSVYIAERFGVHAGHVMDIIRGQRWGHLPVLDYEAIKAKRKPRSANPKRSRAKAT